MPKRAEKRQDAKSFSFRMPGDVYDDLAAVARAHGVDVSSVLNWVLTQHRPKLVEIRAEHEKAMLKATAAREWEKMGAAEALRTLRELLRQLQDEYAALSQRLLDRDERRAG